MQAEAHTWTTRPERGAATQGSPEAAIESRIRIETPENVWLTFRLAGPGPRLWAYLIDLAIQLGLVIFLLVGVGLLTPLAGLSGLPSALGFAGAFLLYWGYGCFFETLWNGRTPGKRALKLRVIKTGGYPIGFYDALLRNLLRVVDGLPVGYGIGLVSVLVTRRFQRLGDLAAGTLVIHERPARHVYPPWVEGVAPFEPREMGHAYRPAERTLDLIEGFLSRAQGLSDERADEIAQLLAEPLRHKLGIADPGGEHLRAPGWFLLRVLRTFVYPPNHPYGPSGAVP